jgi:hypothetical protein
MSVRGFLISLAANFVAAAFVWYFKTPNTGLVFFAIGLFLLVAAAFWPKKPKSPVQPAAPINIHLSNIGNPIVKPEQSQTVAPSPPMQNGKPPDRSVALILSSRTAISAECIRRCE